MRRRMVMPAFVLVALWCAACRRADNPELQKAREAVYDRQVESYSAELRPGITRQAVEDYLRSKGRTFTQACCFEEPTAYADLVRIGEEVAPWACSERVVYVKFEFAGHPTAPRGPGMMTPKDGDILKSVQKYRQLSGCL